MFSRCYSAISILVLLFGCSGSESGTATDKPASPTSSTASGPIQQQKEWYEGGDLHRATIGEWKAATYENKLATSADMVANLRKFSSMGEMRSAAEEMEQCISKVAEGPDAELQRVSEVAAACALLMGYR